MKKLMINLDIARSVISILLLSSVSCSHNIVSPEFEDGLYLSAIIVPPPNETILYQVDSNTGKILSESSEHSGDIDGIDYDPTSKKLFCVDGSRALYTVSGIGESYKLITDKIANINSIAIHPITFARPGILPRA